MSDFESAGAAGSSAAATRWVSDTDSCDGPSHRPMQSASWYGKAKQTKEHSRQANTLNKQWLQKNFSPADTAAAEPEPIVQVGALTRRAFGCINQGDTSVRSMSFLIGCRPLSIALTRTSSSRYPPQAISQNPWIFSQYSHSGSLDLPSIPTANPFSVGFPDKYSYVRIVSRFSYKLIWTNGWNSNLLHY